MPFQQALSSIFLPANSIYASIDQSPSNQSAAGSSQVIYSATGGTTEDDEPTAASPARVPAPNSSLDPFQAVSPSGFSPVPLPHQPLKSHHLSIEEEDEVLDEADEQHDNDPFHDDLDQALERTRSDLTPTSSRTRSRSAVIGSKSLMGLLGGTTYRSQAEASEAQDEVDRDIDSDIGPFERDSRLGTAVDSRQSDRRYV